MPRRSPDACGILNSIEFGLCGVAVHKFRGRLCWCWCPIASALCKLLGKEELMFPTLSDMRAAGTAGLKREICPHCMLLAVHKIKCVDSPGKVSECFRQGLENMIEYNKSVNKQEV